MLSNFITAAVTAAIVAACFLYHYEIIEHCKKDKPLPKPSQRFQWMDFIHANINQSFTKWHCHQCRKLIVLFDTRFRKEVPPHVFNEWINNLYNLLDTKYKTILTEEDEFSNLTSEDAGKMIL